MAVGLGQVISWYICTVAAAIFFVARIWVRLRKFGNIIIEDGLILLSLCCLIGDLAIQQRMWTLGMAEMQNASPDEFVQIMKLIVPGSVLYVAGLWTIKVSLVLFYKRIAAPGSKLQMLYNVAIGVLVAGFLVIFFHIIFQCFPHDRRWSMDPDYQCDPKNAEINYWITILLNIFTDVAVISLPIIMVMKLQMKMKQKLGVAAIFALGFFVIIASIIRAYYSKRNETMLTCTVSMIEQAIAIIVACLPPLRTLFLGHGSSAGTNSGYGHYELSSGGRNGNRSRRTHPSRVATDITGGTTDEVQINGSEDELVKDLARTTVSGKGIGMEGRSANSGITVNTTFEMSREKDTSRAEGVHGHFA